MALLAQDFNVSNPKDIFADIDEENDQHIDFISLQRYFQKCGVEASELELTQILSRVSKDQNGVISITDFTDFFFNGVASCENSQMIRPGRLGEEAESRLQQMRSGHNFIRSKLNMAQKDR